MSRPYKILPGVRFRGSAPGTGPDLVQFLKRGLVQLDLEGAQGASQLLDGARANTFILALFVIKYQALKY